MNTVLHGDCLDVLRQLEADSVDCMVTDPPYGYSFMGKDWDKAVPSVEVWKETLRVLKPGAFAFIMSAPRSDVQCAMISRLQEAGFRLDFTPIYWTYASGFPKAMNIGKMVDKRQGNSRTEAKAGRIAATLGSNTMDGGKANPNYQHTKGNSPLEGSYGGFQPKPAVEVIIVAMKPLSEKTFVDQALKNGKGITWLDDCRVPTGEDVARPFGAPSDHVQQLKNLVPGEYNVAHAKGRFPANLLVSDNVLNDYSRFFSLDEWAQTLPFLIVPKAAKSEKNEGLSDREEVTVGDGRPVAIDNAFQRGKTPRKNAHPTVKPLKLMAYLITLGSRSDDVVLDPFLGSGTTAMAAKKLGRKYIGIEREGEYVEIANARLRSIPNTLFV